MRSAGPMILMCDDQENRARACSEYAPGPTRTAVSLGPVRCGVGGHRGAATGPVPAGTAAGARPPGDRERDLVREPDRVRLAVPAERFPALAHRLRLLRALARRRHPAAAARR